MTNAELLTNFIRYNKVAREVRAKRLGYQSAAEYIAFLNGGLVSAGIPLNTNIVTGVPKKSKKVKAVLSNIPTIHIVDIADKSGSMDGPKDKATVTGINEGIVELQRNKQGVNYTHTYCDFADDVKIIHVAVHPDKVVPIKMGTRGMTALWEAIGKTVHALELKVAMGDKVLVNIYTDGGENASKGVTANDIKELIDKYSAQGWTFTFIGTDRDVAEVIKKVNIKASNTLSYNGTAAGLSKSMHTNSLSRAAFVDKVKKREDTSVGYYSKDIID